MESVMEEVKAIRIGSGAVKLYKLEEKIHGLVREAAAEIMRLADNQDESEFYSFGITQALAGMCDSFGPATGKRFVLCIRERE